VPGPASAEPPQGGAARTPPPGGGRLLWLAAGAFAVLIAAWLVLLYVAHLHPVAAVPDAPRPPGR